MKNIIHQLLQDKNGNFALREVIIFLFVLIVIIAWISHQFFNHPIPEFMFYSFVSIIATGCFGYSIEKKSNTNS